MKYGILYIILGGLCATICTSTTTPTIGNVYGGIISGLSIAFGLTIIVLSREKKCTQEKGETHD